MPSWTPSSWRDFPIQQQPAYADPSRVDAVVSQIASLPPLVHPGEVDSLKNSLAAAGRGEAFLLQGGDCAERFQDCARGPIERKLKILLQMSLVLTWGARLPVVRVGRIAGQFAKPRSKPTEMVNGQEIPSYRGDNVNSHDPSDRQPNPDRLLQAYHHSAATLNYLRALLDGGVADLQHPEHWNLAFVQEARARSQYEDLIARIHDTLDFMRATGVGDAESWRRVDLFTSHEGLLLAYEEAHTEAVGDRYYNLGAHMLWIGDRTRQVDGAHLEYFRGIENPIGLKVGPSMSPEDLLASLRILNPKNELGKVTLITRKAYGGAYCVMNSKHIGADLNFAWPTAEIAVMGPDGAVNIIFRRELAGADDPVAKKDELVADYKDKFANPYRAAELGYVDEILLPRDTRARLVEAFDSLENKRAANPPKKHGNIPL